MSRYYLRSNNGRDKKRRKTNNKISNDEEKYREDSRLPQNSLADMFCAEVVLFEALPYLDLVSIVDKKSVCRQWKEKCDVAINSKGGQAMKKQFGNNEELRNAVKRYCEGNHDDIENIAEEYGYPIGKWDVSKVEDFSMVFRLMTSFNEEIGAWDVGNATNMVDMFYDATSFNQNLSGWDVLKVTNMNGMFYNAYNFNGDVSAWDTSRVTDMGFMFRCARAFNRDLSAWDTSRVTDMHAMFWGAAAFDGDISSWNVSRVTDMENFFTREYGAIDQDRLNFIKLNWQRQGKRWWFR